MTKSNNCGKLKVPNILAKRLVEVRLQTNKFVLSPKKRQKKV